MALWKKKHRVEPHQRVFVCVSGYPYIRKLMHDKGWVENRDKHSQVFDLRFVIRKKDISYKKLLEGQVVNHFEHNSVITSKSGLCKNM